MKTNFEKYKEIVNKNKGEVCVDAETGIPQNGGSLQCTKCLFHKDTPTSCGECRLQWLFEEYKPKHKLTQMEYDILECFEGCFSAFASSAVLRTLKDKGYYGGVVDFENARVEDVLSDYELIEGVE